YELMCGMHDYKQWAEKAKFLGYSALGICEKGTLAGAIQFSEACQKNDLKPIIGFSIAVKAQKEIVHLKPYATNEKGCENLMYLNSLTGLIKVKKLTSYLEGIVVIVSLGDGVDSELFDTLNKGSVGVYFQISTSP